MGDRGLSVKETALLTCMFFQGVYGLTLEVQNIVGFIAFISNSCICVLYT